MSTFRDLSMSDVGYIEDDIVHDRNGKVVGYVHYNDVYQGVPPNGQLTYAIDNKPWTGDPTIYKLTPRSAQVPYGSGYDAKPIGFLTPWHNMYRVYKLSTPGKGQLVGFVDVDDDDKNIYAIAGAALLLLP